MRRDDLAGGLGDGQQVAGLAVERMELDLDPNRRCANRGLIPMFAAAGLRRTLRMTKQAALLWTPATE
ncbi:hypothetical protein GCM10023333_41400 [Ferrimonas pelagia]|uniref:Uncharacterized protein n=1 Tax=Ferrimonas pelagia TaxID=1177826 RepID=A0ABP9FIU2_9GAMM